MELRLPVVLLKAGKWIIWPAYSQVETQLLSFPMPMRHCIVPLSPTNIWAWYFWLAPILLYFLTKPLVTNNIADVKDTFDLPWNSSFSNTEFLLIQYFPTGDEHSPTENNTEADLEAKQEEITTIMYA